MNRIVYVLIATLGAAAVIACSSDDDGSSAPAGTGGETQQEQGGAAGDDGIGGAAGEAGTSGEGGAAGASGSTGGTSGATGGAAGSGGPVTCETLKTKALADMTSSDKKVACTCAAESVGGYNNWVKCGSSSEVCIFEVEADCLNKITKCSVTGAEFFTCWEAVGKDPCGDIFDMPECLNYVDTCW